MSPIYEYECEEHGRFELLQPITPFRSETLCPVCRVGVTRVMSRPTIIKVIEKERLPYGCGSRGRYISHKETGGSDIFVPSWGALEKEEVDDVTQGAIEKERDRVKKKKDSKLKQRLQSYVDLAYSTPKGGRAKTIKKAMGN